MNKVEKLAMDFVRNKLRRNHIKFKEFKPRDKKGCDFITYKNSRIKNYIEVKGRSDTYGFINLNQYNIQSKNINDLPSNWILWVVTYHKLKRVNNIIFSRKDTINRSKESKIWEISMRKK